MSTFSDTRRNKANTDQEAANAPAPGATNSEAQIKVDGFGQVIALLEVADASFRESLINRIAVKDPTLARQIRATLSRN